MKKLLFLLLLIPSSVIAQDWGRVALWTFPADTNTAAVTNNTAMINTNDWVEYINQAPEAVTYTQLCYRTGTLTGAQPTMKIGVEGVSTSTGRADGTYATGTGECSKTFTPSTNNTWACQTITGTTCALTRGQVFAITIRYSSGTIGAGNSPQFGYTFSSFDTFSAAHFGNAYSHTDIAAVDTQHGDIPLIMWATAGNVYYGFPLNTNGGDTACSGQEYGNVFTVPCPTGKTYKVIGARWHGQTAAAGKTTNINLYDGTNTAPIATGAWDSDEASTNAGTRSSGYYFTTTNLPALNCNSPYRLTVSGAEASCSLSISYYTVHYLNQKEDC
jgi:hypothetical protein